MLTPKATSGRPPTADAVVGPEDQRSLPCVSLPAPSPAQKLSKKKHYFCLYLLYKQWYSRVLGHFCPNMKFMKSVNTILKSSVPSKIIYQIQDRPVEQNPMLSLQYFTNEIFFYLYPSPGAEGKKEKKEKKN